jgi:cell filamentation protein, protein adenylyltransferase
MIQYDIPTKWIRYDKQGFTEELVAAKAAILALQQTPYQRGWVEHLQTMELKREVAGTSRIEGADFTERELEEAMRETPEQLHTRSQKQAHAAVKTYRWIAEIPDDKPIDTDLILEIHRNMVTGADDDHCEPGVLRQQDPNVTFGNPRHRGANGGKECSEAFSGLTRALRQEFRDHDAVLQALAAHYHFAAMHPFLDGNGRTARALEALMLKRAGLRDISFIAMSNYYYEEKTGYLKALSDVRQAGHDLTAFLKFALRGVALQASRILGEIRTEVSKVLYKDLMYDLFNRMKTKRKRIIANRQIEILKILLDGNRVTLDQLVKQTSHHYGRLKNPRSALLRDIVYLLDLKAIAYREEGEFEYVFWARLEWPTEASSAEYLQRLRSMPKARTHSFLT